MWSTVLGPAEVTSRAGDKDADIDHKARFRCVDRAGDDPNSHHTVATASRLSMKAQMLVLYPAYLIVGVLS